MGGDENFPASRYEVQKTYMNNVGTRYDEWLEKCAKLKKRQESNLQNYGRIYRLHQTCPGPVHIYALLNLSLLIRRPDQYLSLKTIIYGTPHIFYSLVSGLFTQHLPSYFNDRHFFTPHAEYNLSALINNQGDSSGTWWR